MLQVKRHMQKMTVSRNSFYLADFTHFFVMTEPQHEISNNVVSGTSKGSDQSVHTHSLIRAFASGLNIL